MTRLDAGLFSRPSSATRTAILAVKVGRTTWKSTGILARADGSSRLCVRSVVCSSSKTSPATQTARSRRFKLQLSDAADGNCRNNNGRQLLLQTSTSSLSRLLDGIPLYAVRNIHNDVRDLEWCDRYAHLQLRTVCWQQDCVARYDGRGRVWAVDCHVLPSRNRIRRMRWGIVGRRKLRNRSC